MCYSNRSSPAPLNSVAMLEGSFTMLGWVPEVESSNSLKPEAHRHDKAQPSRCGQVQESSPDASHIEVPSFFTLAD